MNNVRGLVLLPDNWNGAIDPDFVYGDDGELSNNYSIQEWLEMESAGVVFLPASGYMELPVEEGDHLCISDVNLLGCYWSSTYTTMSGQTSAYCMGFYYYDQETDVYNDYTYFSSSVRLIRDIE